MAGIYFGESNETKKKFEITQGRMGSVAALGTAVAVCFWATRKQTVKWKGVAVGSAVALSCTVITAVALNKVGAAFGAAL